MLVDEDSANRRRAAVIPEDALLVTHKVERVCLEALLGEGRVGGAQAVCAHEVGTR